MPPALTLSLPDPTPTQGFKQGLRGLFVTEGSGLSQTGNWLSI
jgi:hypothetical protein